MARSPYARVSDVKDGFDDIIARMKALPVGGDMQKANNLSELPRKDLARDNLDVYSRGEVDSAIGSGGGGGGSGDVVGPATSTTNSLAQFADATGKLLKDGPMLGVASAGSVPTRADADARYLLASLLNAANGVAGLGADAKLPTSLLPDAVLGALKWQGAWNATTNSPAIPTAAAGNKGWYYVVNVAGATSVSGITDWQIGDWLVSNGTAWEKIDNTDQVVSVAGLKGIITGAALKTALSLVKGDVGLGNVDNTSDAGKPVSTAQQAALDLKAALSDTIVVVSTTTYTVVTSDLGKTLRFTNASGCAVTLPNSFAAGFNFLWRHIGAGALTFAAQADGTLNNRQNHTKSAGTKAEGSLAVDTNTGTNAAWWLSGDTAA